MHQSQTRRGRPLLTLTLACAVGTAARAYDVTDNLAINGLLAGAGQCPAMTGGTPLPTLCRGAVVLHTEAIYNPTKHDQFYGKLGFAAWNGLNRVSPFVLVPWGAGLEAEVHHINQSNRNYLLDAWYAHTFEFASDNSVQITGGIIDPGNYVDQNAFAGDEYAQFMNEIFINSHNGSVPSHVWGGALVWAGGPWTLSGVGTNVTKNSEGYNYNWFAAELAYALKTPLGQGNYRLMYAGTSRAFLSPTPATDPTANPDPPPPSKERRSIMTLSFDQELGKVVGVFLRASQQTQDATVDYRSEYSGGFNFKGIGWGRARDNIGIALAYLPGGNDDIAHTTVFETYYRLAFNDHFALTADVQYMQDKHRTATSEEGWIFGLRAVTQF